MKVDAIKRVAAATMAGDDPSDADQTEAGIEAVDLALGFLSDVRRIADAMERLGACADGIHPSAFRTVAQQ